MILNISGRTDIVAFYTPWLINRFKEGFVDVRNPVYPKLVSRIYFKDVSLIVFCTKNPLPIIPYLNKIKIPIIFQITLTSYNNDIEVNVPNKKNIIEGIKKISDIIGIDNVYIRYDPVFLNEKYTLDYHIKAFNKLCNSLHGFTKHIIISFIDNYKNVRNNMAYLRIKNFTQDELNQFGFNFAKIANNYGVQIQTCNEYNNFKEYGFIVSDCVSTSLAKKMTGKNYSKWTSRHAKYCNCAKLIDIGMYNSCMHLCKYCYANYNELDIIHNVKKHNPSSSLLIGNLSKDDIIKVRTK